MWERFDAESLATPEAFRKDKELVWGWYEWRRMKVLRALPNPAHIAISGLARHVPRLTAKQAGACLVQINLTSTGLDRECSWSLRGAAGEIMPRLLQAAFASVDRQSRICFLK